MSLDQLGPRATKGRQGSWGGVARKERMGHLGLTGRREQPGPRDRLESRGTRARLATQANLGPLGQLAFLGSQGRREPRVETDDLAPLGRMDRRETRAMMGFLDPPDHPGWMASMENVDSWDRREKRESPAYRVGLGQGDRLVWKDPRAIQAHLASREIQASRDQVA